jgi:hypothetical protein
MVEYILTIVAGLISTILGFILKSKITEIKKLRAETEAHRSQRERALENGVVCILRKHLMDEHEIWTQKGYITAKALESGLLMYKAYKQLGGNGMIDHMEEEIQALPIRD